MSKRKSPGAHRARQFAPFSPLQGYYELLLEHQKTKETKRVVAEERAEMLSYKLNQVKKRMVIKLECYNHAEQAYETVEGMVSEFDPVFRTITVVKRKIPFDDIWDITVGDGGSK